MSVHPRQPRKVFSASRGVSHALLIHSSISDADARPAPTASSSRRSPLASSLAARFDGADRKRLTDLPGSIKTNATLWLLLPFR